MGIAKRSLEEDAIGTMSMNETLRVAEEDPEVAPPLPEVAWTILEFTTDICCGVVQLEAIIRRDQALAGGILKMANSAYFGLSKRVDSIRQAAVVLGNNRLRNLAVAVSLGGVLKQSAFGRSLWEHSLGSAITASALADLVGYPDRERAFLAGILHDIGKSALNNQHADLFIDSVQLAENEGIGSVEAERRIIGTDHCRIGAMLAKRWSLPATLVEAIEMHHDPLSALEDRELTMLINMADGLCQKMGIGPRVKPEIDLTQLESWTALGLTEDQIDSISGEVSCTMERDKGFFGLD